LKPHDIDRVISCCVTSPWRGGRWAAVGPYGRAEVRPGRRGTQNPGRPAQGRAVALV